MLKQPGHKMEKLVLLMVMFAACFATPEDLTGKVFVFPRESSIDNVKLVTTRTQLNAVTVCMRFLTDLSRNYGLLSLSTPSYSNAFVLFKVDSKDTMRVHAVDGGTDFLSIQLSPNSWHSICSTWHSENGIAQLWLDGKASIKRFIKSEPITGPMITFLGQEQDNYGAGFDANQSFLGMITKLHMWDYVLSSTEIKRYFEDGPFTPGNVFNWRAMEYVTTGKVLVEESQVM